MQEFLSRIKPKQKKYFSELRSALLTFPEIEEAIEIDEMGGEWCPAYRVRGEDLVWVHFNDHMWISVPVDAALKKKVLSDENLDSQLVERVKETEESSEIKWARIDIKSSDGIELAMPLLRLRHSMLRS